MDAESYPSIALCLSVRCGSMCILCLYSSLLMTCMGSAVMELDALKSSPAYLINRSWYKLFLGDCFCSLILRFLRKFINFMFI